jgi:aminoglycoside phosphotransferase (APT) family kinase protein
MFRSRLYVWLSRWRPFGSSSSFRCIKVFPGIYLKWGEHCAAEAESLHLVRRYTTIPIPQVIDRVASPQWGHFLLMTEIRGQLFTELMGSMTEKDLDLVAAQLSDWMSQLRSIPSPDGRSICAPGNAPLMIHRYSEDPIGPFCDAHEFHTFLVHEMHPDIKTAYERARAKPYEICFSHADLKNHNIIMSDQRHIAGIIDWETAGWYPSYWEFVMAHYPIGPREGNKWQ